VEIDIDTIQETLDELLRGKVAFLGIGNTDRADDGAGVALARLLKQWGISDVFEDGPTPERVIPKIRDEGYDTIVFLDAVDAGLEPGSAVILDARRMHSAFPQVSTHKLALSTLAKLAAEGSAAGVWLIGMQPLTLELGKSGLSAEVDSTLHALAQGIVQTMESPSRAHGELLCI
jgi:hydrogenase maturation protease